MSKRDEPQSAGYTTQIESVRAAREGRQENSLTERPLARRDYSAHHQVMDERHHPEDMGALNLRQLLLKRSAWFEEQMVEAADDYGYGFVTPAMNRLFAHMPRQPISISELARRLAVSRQAVHQTVGEACRRRILELVPDDTDARLRKVRFTEEGRAMKKSAALAVGKIEKELERRLGAEDFAALRRILEQTW